MSKKIEREFDKTAATHKYQIGFALYDPESRKMIVQKDADKYFIPASNTKLFTFYAGLKIYPDSIPSLTYTEKGDSLIFWGTGDPSLLHPVLQGTKAINFLKNSSKQLYFSTGRYKGDFYGYGWAWDDYNDYYQAEISEMPLFGNVVHLSAKPDGKLNISPDLFYSCFKPDNTLSSHRFKVQRAFVTNEFYYPNIKIPENYQQEVPYKVSPTLIISLLTDTLKKPIGIVNHPVPPIAKTIYSSKSDDIFRQLMLPSDNFIAEQLLLTYADKLGVEMSTPKVIATIKAKYLTTLPDAPQWLDGSGLSRNNLFTPRSIIKLLEMIYAEVNNQERLFGMLPAGGKSDTLKNAYPKTEYPFVFAKTGSLSGVHNQSGYLITKKGKLLFYAFMNNNFVQPVAEIRKEMVRIMTYIHEHY